MQSRKCIVLYWMSVILLLSSLSIAYGLWAHLFGTPRIGNLFSVVGFFVTVGIGTWFSGWRQRRSAQECSPLAEIHPVLKSVKPYFRLLETGLGIVVAVSGLTIVLLYFNKGVYNTDYSIPIFALRDHYSLLSHGTLTEVTRSEYLLNGISFQVGWHSLMELVILILGKQFVYGRSSR